MAPTPTQTTEEEATSITFRCPNALLERIQAEAKRNERDLSKQIRFMLTDAVAGIAPNEN